MPSSVKKNLYIARTIHELTKLSEVTSKENNNAKVLVKSSEKVYQEAEKAYLDGDEERAYVLYMRYFSTISAIKQSPGYKKDPKHFDDLIGKRNQIIAIEKAENLAASLKTRYDELEAIELGKKLDAAESEISSNVSTEGQPDVPAVKASSDGNKAGAIITVPEMTPLDARAPQGGVTVQMAYRLLTDVSTKLLFLDVRTRDDFSHSHIKHRSCINVPSDAVLPGTTVVQIEKLLPPESIELWRQRSMVDYIVLVDWIGSASQLLPKSPLYSLKDALYKWDPDTKLRSEPLILEGGFEEWLSCYPTYTTNPMVKCPIEHTLESKSDLPALDSIDYDMDFLEPPIIPTINNATNITHELIDYTNASSTAFSTSSEQIAPFTVNSLPTFDRSTKPMQNKSSNLNNTTVVPRTASQGEPQAFPHISNNLNATDITRTRGSSNVSTAGSSGGVTGKNTNVSRNPQPIASLPSAQVKTIPHVDRSGKPSMVKPSKVTQGISDIANSDNAIDEDLSTSMSEMSVDEQDAARMRHANGKERHSKNRNRNDEERYEKDLLELDEIQRKKSQEARELATLMRSKRTIQDELRMMKRKAKDELRNNGMKKSNSIEELKQEADSVDNSTSEEEEEVINSRRNGGRSENSSIPLEMKDPPGLMWEKEREAALEMEKSENAAAQKNSEEIAARQKAAEEAAIRQEAAARQKYAEEVAARQKGAEEAAAKQKAMEEAVARSRTEAAAKQKAIEEAAAKAAANEALVAKQKAEVEEKQRQELLRKKKLAEEEQARRALSQQNASLHITDTQIGQASDKHLPPGWEKRLQPGTSKYYYINHATKTTQWHPPGVESSTQNPAGTYKAPLRNENEGGGGGGLKRSHSSPNVKALVDAERINQSQIPRGPQIDRINKPTSTILNFPLRTEIGPARVRNLNPAYGSLGRGLTGLRNLGNTCYMNSIIQCLSNTAPLVIYFLTDNYCADINRDNKKGTRGEIAEEFGALIKALWSEQYRFVSPKDLRSAVCKLDSMFATSQHQDAQELLEYLMNGLNEDLNKVKVRPKIREQNNDNIPDIQAADLAWSQSLIVEQSIIVELFRGQYKSTVSCLTCHKSSVVFDPFMCLTLPIPPSTRSTLDDCLRQFSKEEKMSGDSQWFCPRCNCKRDAVKRIIIWKLPPILIVHLKRFYYDGIWRDKIKAYVEFPLSHLDMSRYIAGPVVREPYKLFAVTNHFGTLDGGHYTAFCRSAVKLDEWYKFDDQEVYQMPESDIKSSAAYVLFYTSMKFDRLTTNS